MHNAVVLSKEVHPKFEEQSSGQRHIFELGERQRVAQKLPAWIRGEVTIDGLESDCGTAIYNERAFSYSKLVKHLSTQKTPQDNSRLANV